MTGSRIQFLHLGIALALAFASAATAGSVDASVLQPKYGDPLPGLTQDQLDRFVKGREAFDTSLFLADGLGPAYNEESCNGCHSVPVSGGASPFFVEHFGRTDRQGNFDPMIEFGGTLRSRRGLNQLCDEEFPPEATIIISRITTPTFGDGLIDAIPDQTLLDLQDNPPHPAVSGLAHIVPESPLDPTPRVGRFGWKAIHASVRSFSAEALRNEQGLTNHLFPDELLPNGSLDALLDCDTLPDPEDKPDREGFTFVDRVTDFQIFLAGPPQTPRSGMTGEMLFDQIGCTACHVPELATANDRSLPDVLRNKTFRPYSDFLLHDMGELGDGIVQGPMGTEREMRTSPLWGLKARVVWLHDGRANAFDFAERVQQAVDWHDTRGSEAAFSAQAFNELNQSQREAVIDFLDSLGQREFDFTGDHVVDHDDFAAFRACYDNPRLNLTPDDPCSIADVDVDGDVDADDAQLFLIAFDAALQDCDGDNEIDLLQILNGDALDADDNGRIDTCENLTPGDVNGDGFVRGDDLLILLNAWGPCDVCPITDIDLNGAVGGIDLLILLNNWTG